LSISDNEICTADGIYQKFIQSLRVYNKTSAGTVTISVYDAETATTIESYSLDLAIGDTITDKMGYTLRKGDKLIITPTVTGCYYTIAGEIIIPLRR